MTKPLTHVDNLSRGYLIALASAAVLSTTAIFIRYLTTEYQVPALVLAFWRDIFAILLLFPLLGLFRPTLLRLKAKEPVFLFFFGLVLAFFNALWTLSVSLNGAAVATVLAYSSTAFSVLLGWSLLKERLDWVKVLAVFFCLGGCVLVAGALDPQSWLEDPLGILIGIFTGLGYAAYGLMGRKASQRGMNPWTALVYTFAFASVFLLAINLVPGDCLPGQASKPADFFWFEDDMGGWAILLLLAIGPTVAGFGLINVSLNLLPASITNLVLTTEPVFTVVIAYFLLDERLTAVQIIGSLLILAGVSSLRLYEGRKASLVEARAAVQG
jgi:drug/metabolite transporter (DMT)-like permease